MLECSDGTLYTGISTDLERRLDEHNNSAKGAKYTRARRPVTLAYFEELDNRSKVSKREFAIKKLSRKEKIRLMTS